MKEVQEAHDVMVWREIEGLHGMLMRFGFTYEEVFVINRDAAGKLCELTEEIGPGLRHKWVIFVVVGTREGWAEIFQLVRAIREDSTEQMAQVIAILPNLINRKSEALDWLKWLASVHASPAEGAV
jgi:hypothetical protein